MKKLTRWIIPALILCLVTGLLPLGAVAEAEHKHTYSEWKVTQEPNCTDEGVRIRQCSGCGDTQVESIAALGHSWYDWIPIETASCTKEGKEERTCKRDAAHKETRTIAKTPHNMTPWRVVGDPATCTAGGTQTRNCITCSTMDETVSTPATGHDWGPYQSVLDANCTDKGKQVRYCKNDSKHTQEIDVPALGHSWGSWTTTANPTCSKVGTMERVCARDASHRESKDIPALGKNQTAGHRLGPWKQTKAPRCDYVGIEQRSCPDCGRVESRDIPKIKHTSDNKWVEKRAPTLQQKGLRVTTCTVCGQQASSQTFAPNAYRYEVATRAYGPLAGQANSALSGVPDRLIYIDLTQAGTLRFPLVSDEGWDVGTVQVTVGGGTLNLKLEKRSSPSVFRYRTWHVFASAADVSQQVLASESLPFEQTVKVDGESCVISVSTLANYYQGNENQQFSEQLMSLDGVHSYEEQVKLMLEQMAL